MAQEKYTPGSWKFNEDSRWPRCIMACDKTKALGMIRVAELRYASEPDTCLITHAPQLVDALRTLADLQNGPPLVKYEAEWNEAMKKTYALLAKIETS